VEVDVNKHEMMEELQKSRDQLEIILEGLVASDFESPEVWGGWSLKDTLAHLNRWEGEAIKLLFELERGEDSPRVDLGEEDVDRLNSQWQEQDGDRPLPLILSDLRGLRKQTLRRVNDLEDKDLKDPNRYKSLGGKPLWRRIAEDTFEHEQEHLDDLRIWRGRLEDSR
jgi:hypothetical protein